MEDELKDTTDEIAQLKSIVKTSEKERRKTEGELNEMKILDDEKNRKISELKNTNTILKTNEAKLHNGKPQ